MESSPSSFHFENSSLQWVNDTCPIHGPYRAAALSGQEAVCPDCNQETLREEMRREFENRKKSESARKFLSSGVPPIFQEASLSNYALTSEVPNQRQALNICVKYCADFENVLKKGRSLVFLGNVGAGKTHLAVGVMREVITLGRTAKMATIADYFRDCKSAWGRKAELSEIEVLDSYFAPDLLVLDEVGVQFGSKTELDLTFNLINKRYNHAKPNIIIANLDKDQLKEYLGAATYDRLKGGDIVHFTWESVRGLDLSKYYEAN